MFVICAVHKQAQGNKKMQIISLNTNLNIFKNRMISETKNVSISFGTKIPESMKGQLILNGIVSEDIFEREKIDYAAIEREQLMERMSQTSFDDMVCALKNSDNHGILEEVANSSVLAKETKSAFFSKGNENGRNLFHEANTPEEVELLGSYLKDDSETLRNLLLQEEKKDTKNIPIAGKNQATSLALIKLSPDDYTKSVQLIRQNQDNLIPINKSNEVKPMEFLKLSPDDYTLGIQLYSHASIDEKRYVIEKLSADEKIEALKLCKTEKKALDLLLDCWNPSEAYKSPSNAKTFDSELRKTQNSSLSKESKRDLQNIIFKLLNSDFTTKWQANELISRYTEFLEPEAREYLNELKLYFAANE